MTTIFAKCISEYVSGTFGELGGAALLQAATMASAVLEGRAVEDVASDLRALSAEARRAPAFTVVKDACERGLMALRVHAAPPPPQQRAPGGGGASIGGGAPGGGASGGGALDDVANPFLLACNYAGARARLLVAGLAGVQRLAGMGVLGRGAAENAARVLVLQAETPGTEDEVLMKVLQTLPLLVTLPADAVTEGVVSQVLTACLSLRASHRTGMVGHVAEAILADLVRRLFDRAASDPASGAGTAAWRFVADLCAVSGGAAHGTWLRHSSLSPLFCLDMIGSAFVDHAALFAASPAYARLASSEVMPLVQRALRGACSFGALLRVLRIVVAVATQLPDVLSDGCEAALVLCVRCLEHVGAVDSSEVAARRAKRAGMSGARIMAGAHRALLASAGAVVPEERPDASRGRSMSGAGGHATALQARRASVGEREEAAGLVLGDLPTREELAMRGDAPTGSPGAGAEYLMHAPLYKRVLIMETLQTITMRGEVVRALYAACDAAPGRCKLVARLAGALHNVVRALLARAGEAPPVEAPHHHGEDEDDGTWGAVFRGQLDAAVAEHSRRALKGLEAPDPDAVPPGLTTATVALLAVQCCVNIADALGASPGMLHTAFAAQALPRCARTPTGGGGDGGTHNRIGGGGAAGAGDVAAAIAGAAWPPVVAVLGLALEHCENDAAVQYVLKAFQGIANTAGTMGLTEARAAVISTLCTFALPSARPRGGVDAADAARGSDRSRSLSMTSKNTQVLKVLLTIAHCFGDVLGSSWGVMLDTFEQLDAVLRARGVAADGDEDDGQTHVVDLMRSAIGGVKRRGGAPVAAESPTVPGAAPVSPDEELVILLGALRGLFEATAHMGDAALLCVVEGLGDLVMGALADAATAEVEEPRGATAAIARVVSAPSLSSALTSAISVVSSAVTEIIAGTGRRESEDSLDDVHGQPLSPVPPARTATGASFEGPAPNPHVSVNTAAATASQIAGAVVASSYVHDAPPFALVKLVAVTRHNAARATVAWDILSAVLKLVSRNRSARVRRYGVSAAADIACDILLLDPSASGLFGGEAGAPARVPSQAQLLKLVCDFWRSPFSDTRLLALTAVRCVVEAAGDAMAGGDRGGWRPLLGVLASAAVAGSEGAAAGDRAATRDRGAIVPLAFQSVKLIANYAKSLPVGDAVAYIGCLDAFARQTCDVNVSLTAIGMMLELIDVVARTLREGGGGAGMSLADAGDLWLQISINLAALSTDGRSEVRNCALQTLLPALVTHGRLLTPLAWRACIENLQPLLDAVNFAANAAASSDAALSPAAAGAELALSDGAAIERLVVHHSRNTAQKQWGETRVFALQGISRVVVHFFGVLRKLAAFGALWSRLLAVIEGVVKESGGGRENAVPAVVCLQDLGLLVCVPSGPAVAAREGAARVSDGALVHGPPPPPSPRGSGEGASAAGGDSDGERRDDGECLSREALWHGVLAVLTRSAKAPAVAGASEEECATALADAARALLMATCPRETPSDEVSEMDFLIKSGRAARGRRESAGRPTATVLSDRVTPLCTAVLWLLVCRHRARWQACLPPDVARAWAEQWPGVLASGTPWTRPPPPRPPLVVDLAALTAPNFTYISALERRVTESLSRVAAHLASLPAAGGSDAAEGAWTTLFAAARRVVGMAVEPGEFVPPPAPLRLRVGPAPSGASKDASSARPPSGGAVGTGLRSVAFALPCGALAVASTQCFARMLALCRAPRVLAALFRDVTPPLTASMFDLRYRSRIASAAAAAARATDDAVNKGDLDLEALVVAAAGRRRTSSVEDASVSPATALSPAGAGAVVTGGGGGGDSAGEVAVLFPPLAWGFDASSPSGGVVDAVLVKRAAKAARAASEGVVSALLAVVVAGLSAAGPEAHGAAGLADDIWVSLLDMLDGIVGLASASHVAHAGGVHAPLALFGAGGDRGEGAGGASKDDTVRGGDMMRANAAWACDDDLVSPRALAAALGRARGGGGGGGGARGGDRGGGGGGARGGASDGEAEGPSAPAALAEASRRHRHGVIGPDSVLSRSDAQVLLASGEFNAAAAALGWNLASTGVWEGASAPSDTGPASGAGGEQAERHVLESIVAAATHAAGGGALPHFAGARLVAVLSAGALGLASAPRAGEAPTRAARRRRFARACVGHLVGLAAGDRLRGAAAPVLLDRALATLRLAAGVDDAVARRRGAAAAADGAHEGGGGSLRGAGGALAAALVVDTMVLATLVGGVHARGGFEWPALPRVAFGALVSALADVAAGTEAGVRHAARGGVRALAAPSARGAMGFIPTVKM